MQLINYAAVLVVLLAVSFDYVKCTEIILQPNQSTFDLPNYTNSAEIIDSLLAGYDKRLRPNYGGAPVVVEVSMYVISFDSVSDSNMDYTINFYFRQYWHDPRLTFHRPGIETLGFGHDFSKSIWLPDTFFFNEKQGFAHSITAKNEFIKVRSTGQVIRSVRLSVTASCLMNFRHFPMDTQKCPLCLESYGYTASDIRYVWKNEDAVGVTNDVNLNLFELTGHNQNSEFIQVATGNYSRLNVEFELKRYTSHYLMQVYIPCAMLVLTSWISFWLHRRAAHFRLALCALAILTMSISLQILATQLPKTSYPKAIDVYTGVSMTFVFLALVECAYISNTPSDKEDFASLIDLAFRYGYAVLFAVFNVIYWLIF